MMLAAVRYLRYELIPEQLTRQRINLVHYQTCRTGDDSCHSSFIQQQTVTRRHRVFYHKRGSADKPNFGDVMALSISHYLHTKRTVCCFLNTTLLYSADRLSSKWPQLIKGISSETPLKLPVCHGCVLLSHSSRMIRSRVQKVLIINLKWWGFTWLTKIKVWLLLSTWAQVLPLSLLFFLCLLSRSDPCCSR